MDKKTLLFIVSLSFLLSLASLFIAESVLTSNLNEEEVSLEQPVELIAESGEGSCYTVYGSNSCAQGYTKVIDGYTTVYALYASRFENGWGTQALTGDLVCSPITHTDSYRPNYLEDIVAFSASDSYTSLNNEVCAMCCK